MKRRLKVNAEFLRTIIQESNSDATSHYLNNCDLLDHVKEFPYRARVRRMRYVEAYMFS